MVGGCVRDRILGREAKDIDFEVFGVDPAKAIAAFPGCNTVGKSFGVIKLGDIDIAFPRRETKLGSGHRGFAIEADPSLSLAEAAARRDFTINAIYEDPLTGERLDPYGGIADLEKRVLRQVSSHFAEDPLRVLRAMQFIARFDLSPAPELVAVCRGIGEEGLSKERKFEEWGKLLLKGEKISKGLSFLREVGWVEYYPELERCIGCGQDPVWHPEGDVWNHTLECLDRYAAWADAHGGARDLVTAFAVLCHDFGKPFCTKFDPAKGRIRSLGHDEIGVEHARGFLLRLTDEIRLLKEVPALVREHMKPFAFWRDGAGDSAIRRLAARVGRIDRLIDVARADGASAESLEFLRAAAARLEVSQSAPKPIVLGRHLLERGMKSGPGMGKILAAAYEAQLDGRFFDVESGLDFCYNTLVKQYNCVESK